MCQYANYPHQNVLPNMPNRKKGVKPGTMGNTPAMNDEKAKAAEEVSAVDWLIDEQAVQKIILLHFLSN